MAELFDARSTPHSGDKTNGNDHDDRSKGLSEKALQALSVEFALSQQFHKAERANPNALDLLGEAGYSAVYQGAQSPITSLGQIGDNLLSKADVKTNIAEAVTLLPAPEHEEFGTARWHAQQIGGGIGMILPFIATKSALSKTGLSFAARTEASVYASSKLASAANAGLVADGALTGFAYDFLLRPVDQQDSGRFWAARGEHGLAGAATFGTLTAGSVGLRHMSRSLAASLVDAPKIARVAYDATMGALPGVPAGVVNADVSARLSKGRWATAQERTEGAYTMFMAGGTLSALHAIPGSDVPLGDIAREYQSRKAATQNLESMLAERARNVEAPVAGKSEAVVPEFAKLTGRGGNDHSSRAVTGGGGNDHSSRAVTGGGGNDHSSLAAAGRGGNDLASRAVAGRDGNDHSSRAAADGPLRPGRAMASGDVEKVAQATDVQLVVPREHVETLRTGVDLAFKASDVDCTPQQVLEFFNFARGQGAPIKQAMLDVAKQYAGEDPHMMTLIKEAYMPPEGVENRVVEGDVKLKTSDATTDQYKRWGQFMQIVREMPQDTAGYIEFRHDVFRWLNENKDLHDWAKQYGEQNRYSKIAGPLDYYFGTDNLARFVAADAAAHPAPTPAEVKPTAEPVDPALLDVDQLPGAPETHNLTADLPPAFTAHPDPALFDVDNLPLAARFVVDQPASPDVSQPAFRAADQPTRLERPPADLEPAFRPQERTVLSNEMTGLELGGPSKRRIVANQLADRIGRMTTDEFGRWLDYVYAKPAEGTTSGAMNLNQMFIKQKAALLNPDVVEAYLRHKGVEVAPREGANEIPLEQVRRFLGNPPKAQQGEMPEWMRFYIEARMAQVRQSAGAEATPAKVLSDALPRWFTERIKAEYVTPGRWAGNAPTYSANLPKEIAQQLEAARRTEPLQPNRTPKKEFTPPANDLNLRLERLNELVKVDDPVIRDRLMELGSQDHTVLRNIVQKLDPAKSAPEYKELLKLVLPEAKNISDVKLLLDTIFFGNKAHRNDAGSEQTKANMQLAMALAEHMVPQSNENFGRVNQLIGDMITGKIRDPRPERPDGDGGGGRGDGRGGRGDGRGGRADGRDARGDGQGKDERQRGGDDDTRSADGRVARGDGQGKDERQRGGDDDPWSATVQPFVSPAISPFISPIMGSRGSGGSRAIEAARERTNAADLAAKQRLEADAALKAQQDAVRKQLDLAASIAIQHAMLIASQRQAELEAMRARQTVRDPYLEPTKPYTSPVSKPYSSPISRGFGRMF